MSTQSLQKQITFGLLPVDGKFRFDRYMVEPLSNVQDVFNWIESNTCTDGFIYPPVQAWVSQLANSTKTRPFPSHLFRVPASHSLTMIDNMDFACDADSEAYFIVQCLGLLYEYRTTFGHWWLDNRAFFGRGLRGDIFGTTADDFLERALTNWRKMLPESRKAIGSIIWLHLRCKSHQWDFDRFSSSYSVSDAIFRVAKTEGRIPEECGHAKRLANLVQVFGLSHDENKIRLIVTLRNNLLHELKWDKGKPGTATGTDGLEASLWLPRLNQRLLIALLGYKNVWTSTPWWNRGQYHFDRMPDATN